MEVCGGALGVRGGVGGAGCPWRCGGGPLRVRGGGVRGLGVRGGVGGRWARKSGFGGKILVRVGTRRPEGRGGSRIITIPLIPPAPCKDKWRRLVCWRPGADPVQPSGLPLPHPPLPASLLPLRRERFPSRRGSRRQTGRLADSSFECNLVSLSGTPRAGTKPGPGQPPPQLSRERGDGRAPTGLGMSRLSLAASLPRSARRGQMPVRGPPPRSAPLLGPRPTPASSCPRTGEGGAPRSGLWGECDEKSSSAQASGELQGGGCGSALCPSGDARRDPSQLCLPGRGEGAWGRRLAALPTLCSPIGSASPRRSPWTPWGAAPLRCVFPFQFPRPLSQSLRGASSHSPEWGGPAPWWTELVRPQMARTGALATGGMSFRALRRGAMFLPPLVLSPRAHGHNWTALCMPQDLNPGASILETQQWLHQHRFSSYCRLLANFTGEAGVWQGPYLEGTEGRTLRQEVCLWPGLLCVLQLTSV